MGCSCRIGNKREENLFFKNCLGPSRGSTRAHFCKNPEPLVYLRLRSIYLAEISDINILKFDNAPCNIHGKYGLNVSKYFYTKRSINA